MFKLFLASIILAGLGYQGYCNYQSYPKPIKSIHNDVKNKNNDPSIVSASNWGIPFYSTSYDLTIKTKKKDWKRR